MKQTDSLGIHFVAFHYPPIVGSSGVYRTLSFSRYFAEHGWRVNVITASVIAYDVWSEKQYALIPSQINVTRALCLDTTKHLSFKGKYFSFMSIPDNWQSWIPGGVISGILTALKNKPKVIFSTYPIATAHLIGYLLHRVLGVPWIADLRDPMAQQRYPANIHKRKVYQWLERKIVERCAFAIVTAPSAKALYLKRFPQTTDDFWKVIPNGYDDVTFDKIMDNHLANSTIVDEAENNSGKVNKIVILHSGIIYPAERDPSYLFNAIAELKKDNQINGSNLEIRLRATGHDELYAQMIQTLGIADIVSLQPTVSYEEAIKEMLTVDGLLLMQSDGCNYQIPAKSYEYIKIQKPILGLMPVEGDTGRLIASLDISEIAPLDDTAKIKNTLSKYLQRIKSEDFTFPDNEVIEQYSRTRQAKVLEQLVREL